MIRTFVYGSCVSRDTFEYLPEDRFELVQYVARQSLISAHTPPPQVPAPHMETTSPFQRRMLEGDWVGSLLSLLHEHADSVDLLLWDLCDERLGIRLLDRTVPGDGAVATRSVDGIRTGVDHQLEKSPLVPFGSARHRLMFRHALRSFTSQLKGLGLLDRTLVLAPAWATHTLDGRRTPTSFGLGPTRANRLYDDYHSTIGHVTGVPVVRVPPAEVAADPDHPWGVAPFHYTASVYTRLVAAINEKCGDASHSLPGAHRDVKKGVASSTTVSELDMDLYGRQEISSAERRPSDAEELFAELSAGTLRQPPHPPWEKANVLDWTADPFGDRNWCFQHHTLRWLNPVRHLAMEGKADARAFWLTAVKSWVDTNIPASQAPSPWAWKDMGDGLRAIQLSLGAPLVPEGADWFSAALTYHRDWLRDQKNIVRKNHALHQHVGLFVVASVLRDRDGQMLAVDRLERLFTTTFDEQGANDEGSVGYHRMNMNWWTQAWRRVEAEGLAIPPEAQSTMVRASEVLAHFTQPDGFLTQIGDTSRGRLPRATSPAVRYAATLGREGKPPPEPDLVLNRGYVVARSGWSSTRGTKHSHMVARFGEDVRAHSHHDRGAIHFYADGRPWLVDSGFYNYQNNDPFREYTLSRAAHNLAFVEGRRHDDRAPVDMTGVTSNREWIDFTLIDRGFEAATWERRVTYFREADFWVVHDVAKSDGPVRLHHQWIVDVGVRLALHDRGFSLSAEEGTSHLHWIGRSRPVMRRHHAVEGDHRGWIATSWNTKRPGAMISAGTADAAKEARLVMIFSGGYPTPLSLVSTDVNSKGTVSGIVGRGSSFWRFSIKEDAMISPVDYG